MRVRMLVTAVGPGVYRKAGEELDLDRWEAMRLIQAEQAEPIVPHEGDGVEYRDWPLEVSPQWYLQRYPDGPNAALARKVIDAA